MGKYLTAFIKDHLKQILGGIKLLVEQQEAIQKKLTDMEDKINALEGKRK